MRHLEILTYSLELIHKSVLKLSKSEINSPHCDFIISKLIKKFSDFDETIATKLKENIIIRINKRRTLWSDIFMYLTLDDNISSQSLFYKEPTEEELRRAIEFVDPDKPETFIDQESILSLDDLDIIELPSKKNRLRQKTF